MPTCDVSAAKLSPRSSAPCMWQRRKQRERRETPSRAVHHMMRRHPETVCSAALCPDCPVHNNTEERERERERERESTALSQRGLTDRAHSRCQYESARRCTPNPGLLVDRSAAHAYPPADTCARSGRQAARQAITSTDTVRSRCLPVHSIRHDSQVETATGGVTRQPGARVSHVPRQSAPPA
jgi:hypothetical protein